MEEWPPWLMRAILSLRWHFFKEDSHEQNNSKSICDRGMGQESGGRKGGSQEVLQ